MSWYRTGTLNLTNGSINVTGVGTAFIENVRQGFALIAPDLKIYEVSAVTSDTALQLATTYQGSTASGQPVIIFQTQGIIADLSAQIAELLSSFVDLRNAYLNGDLIGTGLEIKAILNDPSELPSTPMVGDAYLVDTSIYVYTALGWQFTNIAGIVPRGNWDAGTDYAYNDTVTYQGSQYRRIVAGQTSAVPNTDTTSWTVFVAKGDTGNTGPAGVTARGSWSAVTAYAVNDIVLYAGSQYRRLIAGTTAGNPIADTTNWTLFVSKGTDGTGVGTVTSVNNISPDVFGNVAVPADVQQFANLAALPATGVVATLYIAADTGKTYRWTGSAYTLVSSKAASDIAVTPSGLITATTVQTALQEVSNAPTGIPYPLSDLNADPSAVPGGFYRSFTALTNRPSSEGTIILTKYNSTTANFLYQDNTGAVFTRTYTGGAWVSGWKRQVNSLDQKGVSLIDFGAFPGKASTELVVTGQTNIATGSTIKVWMNCIATADHSAQEHIIESITLGAADIVPGVGFTIYAVNDSQLFYNNQQPMLYGTWSVAWEWK